MNVSMELASVWSAFVEYSVDVQSAGAYAKRTIRRSLFGSNGIFSIYSSTAILPHDLLIGFLQFLFAITALILILRRNFLEISRFQ